MAGHEMAAASGQVRPCECDVCVCIRALRAAYAAQCPDPETKSRILLRQWLSPEQLTQYDARGAFEVIGSKTGKRYRIEGRRQQNVCELDRKGRRIRGLCFMPEGRLATGDVMLCQKIALETDDGTRNESGVAVPGGEGTWQVCELGGRDLGRCLTLALADEPSPWWYHQPQR